MAGHRHFPAAGPAPAVPYRPSALRGRRRPVRLVTAGAGRDAALPGRVCGPALNNPSPPTGGRSEGGLAASA
jgi:hypothetical protein